MKRLVLACIGILITAADTYVIVLALPDMMLGIGLDLDEMHRAAPIVSGFLLGYVAMLPLIGKLSDQFGRTPILVWSLLLFTFGSMVTATAVDLPEAVLGRFLQGVGGGGLVPTTLALVADLWPERRRGIPLGVVGAVQELGSVLGPLFGAAVLAFADWRMIFWISLFAGAVLAIGFVGRRPRLPDPIGMLLAAAACTTLTLTLTAPDALRSDVTIGALFVSFTDSRYTSPIGLVALVLLIGFVVRELTTTRPLFNLRALPRSLASADLTGALLLALALAGVVVAFAVADPEREVLSPAGPWLLAGAVIAGVAFVLAERRSDAPLVPRGALRSRVAVGALVISFLIGAALIAALVDVPVFARTTVHPDSQVDAAFVLLRFLVPLPIGALLGGWLLRRVGPALITSVAMALAAGTFALMTGWDTTALTEVGGHLVLVLCGFGFGLAIAPVNAALLAVVPRWAHGICSALLVVARMVGMLVGISGLTAIGLRRFWIAQQQIAPPSELCPSDPANCPAYVDALRDAALTQIHTVFAGAAVCAGVAAVLAPVLLRTRQAAGTDSPATPPR